MNKRYSKDKITYGQLRQALVALGFVRKQTSELIAYREMEHNALILLPVKDDRALVGDPHMVSVATTISGKGIATIERLASLLHSPNMPKPVVPSSNTRDHNSKGIKRSGKSVGAPIAQVSEQNDQ